jgi:hypothetical protein
MAVSKELICDVEVGVVFTGIEATERPVILAQYSLRIVPVALYRQ